MTERPILFSGPMVRALLDGRKTQTRRIVKPQPAVEAASAGFVMSCNPASNGIWSWLDSPDLMEAGVVGDSFRCPYGLPGDRLWVREGHAIVPRTAYARSEGVQQILRPDDNHDACVYREGWERSRPGKWRPSIHMPRWASRLTLEITNVRIERLQDISPGDAEAEGTQEPTLRDLGGDLAQAAWSERQVYSRLWDHINGKGSWAANPWVWAVSFRVAS